MTRKVPSERVLDVEEKAVPLAESPSAFTESSSADALSTKVPSIQVTMVH